MSLRSIFHLIFRHSVPTVCIGWLLVVFLTSCSSSTDNGNEIRVPQNIVVNAGSREVELSWQGISGADSYTVYWQVGSAVDKNTAYTQNTSKPQ